MYPDCIRCGMCCISMPCVFSETDDDDICIYLSVNDDNTTTCSNKKANALYIGSGCAFMSQEPTIKEMYERQMEFYHINERKQKIKTLTAGRGKLCLNKKRY